MQTRQPNSRTCFVCGLANSIGLKLRFESTGPDEVMAEYSVPEQYQGYPGVVHGGIVAAMLDEVCGRAHMVADPKTFLYTARLNVCYRKNTPVGKPLRIVGRALTRQGRKATSQAAIYGPDGELLAEAEALLISVPAEKLDPETAARLGWRVYEDDEVEGAV